MLFENIKQYDKAKKALIENEGNVNLVFNILKKDQDFILEILQLEEEYLKNKYPDIITVFKRPTNGMTEVRLARLPRVNI